MSTGPQEIGWENLDKRRFYAMGIGIFSGVTTCLYPLTVIKTRHIAAPVNISGTTGLQFTVSEMWRSEGIRAFYKGFGTVCVGTIPARVFYMSALELAKSGLQGSLHRLGLSDVMANGTINLLAGASASLCSQTLFVPIDVVSQRLMVLNNTTNAPSMNGLSMARLIIRQEGIAGLYKGFAASVGTYVPTSAIWWGSYGFLQKVIWNQLDRMQTTEETPLEASIGGRYLSVSESGILKEAAKKKDDAYSINTVVAVQTTAALLSGLTSAVVTTPLDVIKTKMQLSIAEKGKGRVTVWSMCRTILMEQGPTGFMRGIVPRAASTSLWGTSMVSAYEFLKRAAAIH